MKLGEDGCEVLQSILSDQDCVAVAEELDHIEASRVGTRNLLTLPWCLRLADQLKSHPRLRPLLTSEYVAVQCTYFKKSTAQNWLVSLHQDLSIPVAEQIDHPGLSGWTLKENIPYVQAPPDVLESLIAVRLHIDDCSHSDGPLKVVPGSHLYGQLSPEAALSLRNERGEVACIASRGDLVVMHPLILHASSKSSGSSLRRVLHFLFGPGTLPYGLRWHNPPQKVCEQESS